MSSKSEHCCLADDLARFLRKYSFLWRHHAVDFYINDYWNSETDSLPGEWKEPLKALSYEGLLHLAAVGSVNENWPDSLKEFVAVSQSLPLSRDVDDEVAGLVVEGLDLDVPQKIGMSDKKQHEVHVLAALINKVAKQNSISLVMDLGAGQGYLDSVLCFQYGMTVIGVDDDEIQTCGAKRRSDKLLSGYNKSKSLKARDGRIMKNKTYHLNRRVTFTETFVNLLAEVRQASTTAESVEINDEEMVEDHAPWLLCGLHACGNLSVASIKHFIQSQARALVNVGCCYNKLTEATDTRKFGEQRSQSGALDAFDYGYPLSAHLRHKSAEFELGFTARTLACQATCRWNEQEGAVEAFTRHHYRALLQYLLKENGLLERARQGSKGQSAEQDIIVGRLRPNAFSKGFASYTKTALSRLQIDVEQEGITDDYLNQLENEFESRQKEIAAVWTLRAMLGSAIESLILLDRIIYLAEAGIEAKLIPIFDQVQSPRNMVIVAVKNVSRDISNLNSIEDKSGEEHETKEKT